MNIPFLDLTQMDNGQIKNLQVRFSAFYLSKIPM
jgi:hypothetical protein